MFCSHTSRVLRRSLLLGIVLFGAAAGPLRAQASNRRDLAALRADMGVLNENMHKLHAAQEALQEENGDLRKAVTALRTRMNALADENRGLQSKLKELREQLAAEKQARRSMADKLVETVSSEVERIVSRHTAAPPARHGGSTAQGGGDIPIQGRYTVVRGDTLSAIAAAFDISVKRLKRANKLGNDFIREGQVLNIPEAQ